MVLSEARQNHYLQTKCKDYSFKIAYNVQLYVVILDSAQNILNQLKGKSSLPKSNPGNESEEFDGGRGRPGGINELIVGGFTTLEAPEGSGTTLKLGAPSKPSEAVI